MRLTLPGPLTLKPRFAPGRLHGAAVGAEAAARGQVPPGTGSLAKPRFAHGLLDSAAENIRALAREAASSR
jgi:hypothetical protein